MIVNSTGIKTSGRNVLDEIRDSHIQFHLTGSRFFGTDKPESDWDFFVAQDEPLLSSWLGKHRFHLESLEYDAEDLFQGHPRDFQKDPSISSVYSNTRLFSKARPEFPVHIQVIREDMIEIKKRAQDIIKARNLLFRPNSTLSKEVSKKMNKAIWCGVQHGLLAKYDKYCCTDVFCPNEKEYCFRDDDNFCNCHDCQDLL